MGDKKFIILEVLFGFWWFDYHHQVTNVFWIEMNQKHQITLIWLLYDADTAIAAKCQEDKVVVVPIIVEVTGAEFRI